MKSSSELRFFLACGFFCCAGGDCVVVSPPPDGAPAPAAAAMLGAMTSAAAIDSAPTAASRLTDESTRTEAGLVSTLFMVPLSARFFSQGPRWPGERYTERSRSRSPALRRPARQGPYAIGHADSINK